jgi:hypothetical protein
MESFLSSLNDLIASADGVSDIEIIGAIELTKQQLMLELFADDIEGDQ